MDDDPDRARMIGHLERLVAYNTENPPGAELEAARYLGGILDHAGFECEIVEFLPGRANVIAKLCNGEGPVLAFNTHIDVVPAADGWSADPFTLRAQEGRLIGRGACDAKGPLVALLEAALLLAAIRNTWSGTLLAVFVADEEIGSLGARLYAKSRPAIDGCIVGEPTSNRIATAHKGSMRPLVRVKGRTAHSATPDEGVNAILMAAPLLAMVEGRHRALAARSHSLVGSPSLTVTRIMGGHADNSVPEACEILFDRRMIPGEDEVGVQSEFEHLLVEAKRAHGVEAEIVEFRPTTGGATETSPDLPIVAAARAAAERHGVIDTTLHGLSGACDLVHFHSIGAQGVVIGPGSVAMAHKPDEYVPEDEFLTASLIYRDTALGVFAGRRRD